MPAPKNNKNALKKEGVKESHIHFRVRQELKAKWVHEAQAEGLKLSAWITKKCEEN